MRSAIALLLLVAANVGVQAQTPPAPAALRIVSPARGEPATGAMTLQAALEPAAPDATLTFYVDGAVVCENVPAVSGRCAWNAGNLIREHLIRIVATVPGAARVVATMRTGKVDVAESVRVSVVQVGAIVTDRDGNLVSGLSKADFRLFDEGAAQPITHFSSSGVDLDILLALDVSASMTSALPALKEAAGAFLKAVRPVDRVSLLAFNESVFMLAEHEKDHERLVDAVEQLKAFGGTALYDALGKAIDTVGDGVGRKAIVVFSDGGDRDSALSLASLQRQLDASDAMVFIVALGEGTTNSMLKNTLETLAESTGGRVLFVDRPKDLTERFQTVLDELSHQYVLGFDGKPAPGNALRALRVEMVDKKYRVRARKGYRPPPD